MGKKSVTSMHEKLADAKRKLTQTYIGVVVSVFMILVCIFLYYHKSIFEGDPVLKGAIILGIIVVILGLLEQIHYRRLINKLTKELKK